MSKVFLEATFFMRQKRLEDKYQWDSATIWCLTLSALHREILLYYQVTEAQLNAFTWSGVRVTELEFLIYIYIETLRWYRNWGWLYYGNHLLSFGLPDCSLGLTQTISIETEYTRMMHCLTTYRIQLVSSVLI